MKQENKTTQLLGILPQEVLSLIRKLYAHRLNHADVVKMQMLLMGITDLMDYSRIYSERFFNQIRLRLKYCDSTHMLNAVVKSQAFILIRQKEDDRIVGFASPVVNCTVTAPDDCYLQQPQLTITGSDKLVTINDTQLYISKDIIERPKKGGRSGKNNDLVDEPTAEMMERSHRYFDMLKANAEMREEFFGAWRNESMSKHGLDEEEGDKLVDTLIDTQLVPHIARRKYIETFKDDSITAWLRNIMKGKYHSYHEKNAMKMYLDNRQQQREQEIREERDNHPYSQYEWTDGNCNRHYYDPLEQAIMQIPIDAPARPSDNSIFNPLTRQWKTINNINNNDK